MEPQGRQPAAPLRVAELSDGRRVTPMLRQFADLKEQVPDALLFFRMGDFYELFFEDAEVAAGLLDLTLTARDKLGERPIPMAGVPHHAVRNYIRKLIELGHKVAVADQVEDPKTARGIVKRAITEVITPGIVTDPENLDAKEANYLSAIVRTETGAGGLAYIDVSTGEFACTELDEESGLLAELDRLAAREVLFDSSLEGGPFLSELQAALDLRWTPVPVETFERRDAERELKDLFAVADLGGFGLDESDAGLRAAGAILHYLRASHVDNLGHVRRLRPYRLETFMGLDENTRRNLELFRTLADRRRKGSLLGLMDQSITSMGSRRIRQWISAPLLNPADIDARLDAVALMVDSPELRAAVRDRLARVQDVERLTGRLMSGRANARDLVALRRSLEEAPAIDQLLDRDDARSLPLFAPFADLSDLCADIEETLADDPPAGLKEGGLIRRGCHPELDELITLSREGKAALARIETEERKKTGIGSLKVRYNRVFGYYIEVTRANLSAVPEHYIRKQTLANSERYYTPELKEFEAKVLGAEERRCTLELELFTQLRNRVAARAAELGELASRLADVDAGTALAELAVRHDYVRPTVDDGLVLHLEAARHPVVERMNLGERFVPNDVHLDPDEHQLLIVSGPNMAGKSTVMRQVALIALMAQAGSFVPAREAHLGVVDRIFTRVGASDNLARGQSTFMVEMSETAAILHQATSRSLCILDEIGRGTSTYDGLAIAWAVAEHIADRIHCRTMFATHYHELSQLALTRDHVQNVNIAVSELGGQVVFLRRLRPGSASRSYGIQVARLAGLPDEVLVRSRELLANLETDAMDSIGDPRLARRKGEERTTQGQLTLFNDPGSLLRDELMRVDMDQLTPLEALNLLADLKSRMGSS
ncbi:MAG: DNA mismatch repair protein MutS [Deltaproteobacteria bacterium]|nr:DNA mismatch repair protein MutS [Deltaproteobacteria bacterium]